MDSSQLKQQQLKPQQRSEIEQFLLDVRDHFRSSLETSQYENASNLFHVTEADTTENLLQRCEQLLLRSTLKYSNNTNKGAAVKEICNTTQNELIGNKANSNKEQYEDDNNEVAYLDMSANSKKKKGASECNDLNTSITDSDKTFRCSTRIDINRMNGLRDGGTTTEEDDSDIDELTDNNDDDQANGEGDGDKTSEDEPQIYDICHVTPVDVDETQKAITPELLELTTQVFNCPYNELPAGHLTIQQSSKYGQLQRIEKRLFFDQTKKCYCGILNDWLLIYADGPTASRPSLTLHLKSNGIEIEHSGEGKRREICFQITTADPNKKFVFQAINEVDAKEWIHAIEAAIRGDNAAVMKNARKLPTPPILKRMTFMSHSSGNIHAVHNNSSHSSLQGDGIYEEPSPLYHVHEPTELLITKDSAAEKHITEGLAAGKRKPPELPLKNNNPIAIAKQFEYDVPKCPAQPLNLPKVSTPTESETAGLLNTSDQSSIMTDLSPLKAAKVRSTETVDFQTKVKDVHSKLSSQLVAAAGANAERFKKVAKKTYSNSSTESEVVALTISPPPTTTAKEQKKQKKLNAAQASPQKQNGNSNVANNSNGSSNNNSNNCNERSAKSWFLNRLNKSTSSARNSALVTPTKCKQSENEKENLLNSLEMSENYESADFPQQQQQQQQQQQHQLNNSNSSNPASPILKFNTDIVDSVNGCKNKVNMIINQFESSGHLSMFSVAGSAVATFSSFCENDNYEPIMTVSTPPSSFMKRV